MYKMKGLKKVGVWLLSVAITVTMTTGNFIPNVKGDTIENILPFTEFATGSQIRGSGDSKVFGLVNRDAEDTYTANRDAPDKYLVGKIKFGDKSWLIAGKDNTDENIAVLSTSDFKNDQKYNENYSDTAPGREEGVYSDFNNSDILTLLKDENSELYTHFTEIEKTVMEKVRPSFYEYAITDQNGSTKVSAETKLYLPDGEDNYPWQSGGVNTNEGTLENLYTIYLGENNDIPVYVPTLTEGHNKMDENNTFWLRSANCYNYMSALVCTLSGPQVYNSDVDNDCSLVPATNLNLSSVIFSSSAIAAPVATTTDPQGEKLEIDKSNGMTLRWKEGSNIPYTSRDIGTVEKVIKDGKEVGLNVKKVGSEDKFVVIQTRDGAWTKKI